MGAELITVSTDTQFTHLAWQRHEKELEGVAYPMGSDATGELSRLFGVYDPTTGLAHRGTFIIDPNGRLMAVEITADAVGRNIDEMMRKFKANLYVTRNPNKGCPSKWKEEGDKVLEPSADLVGNVHQALHD